MDHDLQSLNLQSPRMLPHKLHLNFVYHCGSIIQNNFESTIPVDATYGLAFLSNWLLRRRLLKNFLNTFLFKNSNPLLWPHPTSGDHNLKNADFTIFEDDSTQILAFMVIFYLKDF